MHLLCLIKVVRRMADKVLPRISGNLWREILISPKDNSNHPSHDILSFVMVDPGTNVDSKDDANLVGMDVDNND